MKARGRKKLNKRIKQLSSGPLHHFYGYYGINVWDRSLRYHLALETTFDDHKPQVNDKAGVGVIDKTTSEFIKYAETSAFNLQQGSMMHWIDAGFGEEFTYNSFTGDNLISYAINIKTRKKRRINGAVAAVAPDGKEGIGLNFIRMSFCRPVVGYAYQKNNIQFKNIPEDDGLFQLNFKTGEAKFLLPISEVIKNSSDYDIRDNKPVWFNHVLYNTDGSRILFLCRIKAGYSWLSSLWTVNSDGSDLECQIPFGYWISHMSWKDENTILLTTDYLGKSQYIEFTDGKDDFRPVEKELLREDGHCSYSPDRNWILSDTYPLGDERITSLFLYNIKKKKKIILGQFHHDEKYQGVIRCDLHPRFSRDGNFVTFDSVHGKNRQIYFIDVSEIVNS